MKILFIADPLDHFKIAKDSTYAMMQEAVTRAHTLFFATAHDLLAAGGRLLVDAQHLTLNRDLKPNWYRVSDRQRQCLTAFNAVLMRKDPPFDLEYLYATQLLSLAQKEGVKVFNHSQALRDLNEKLAILHFPDWIPPTLVSSHCAKLHAFINQQFDVILKPLDSMGGNNIFRVRPDDPNINVILENLTEFSQRTIMAQRYIPEIRDGDKRILLIDGEPVEYCLARLPKAGETRGNLAAGGRGEARILTKEDLTLARSLGTILRQQGILFAGLDVIGPYLTEINLTSPTCFREIMDQTGLNVAALFIDALERAVEA